MPTVTEIHDSACGAVGARVGEILIWPCGFKLSAAVGDDEIGVQFGGLIWKIHSTHHYDRKADDLEGRGMSRS
jgi:hypothetical protein